MAGWPWGPLCTINRSPAETHLHDKLPITPSVETENEMVVTKQTMRKKAKEIVVLDQDRRKRISKAASEYKKDDPEINSRQIQQRLVFDGICNIDNLPSSSTIQRCLQEQGIR